MTQDEIKALIEDLRLNHEFCPKEVILQAADELERMQVRIPRPPKREWVGLTEDECRDIAAKSKITEPNDEPIKFGAPSRKCIRDLILLIETKLREKNGG